MLEHSDEKDFSETEITLQVRQVEAEALPLLCCKSLDLAGAEYRLRLHPVLGASFLVAGLVGVVLLTPLGHQLPSRGCGFGALLSLVIFLPNIIWQFQHDFISLDFLRSVHGRDIRIGRTDDFLFGQLFARVGLLAIPLVAGSNQHTARGLVHLHQF